MGLPEYTAFVLTTLKRVIDYFWQWRARAKMGGIILVAMLLLTIGIWYLAMAWVQPPVDFWTSYKSRIGLYSLRTTITLDSLDPDTSTVAAHVSTQSLNDVNAFLFDPLVIQQFPELKSATEVPDKTKYKVYYQKPEVSDLSQLFELTGLNLIRQEAGHADFNRVKPFLEMTPPQDRSSILSVIGDPRMFPFDRYMVLFQCEGGDAWIEYKNKVVRMDSGFNVLPRFPGLVVREMSPRELVEWEGRVEKTIWKTGSNKTYNAAFWQDSAAAIVIERPLFLRILTVVIGIVAIVSIVFVYKLSEPSKYYLNSLGAFAALWGARSILSASAPKLPNLVDFAVLVLFIAQFVFVFVRALLARRKSSSEEMS